MKSRSILFSLAFAVMMVGLLHVSAQSVEITTSGKTAAKQEQKATNYRRLPAHVGKLVTEEQRKKIYEIQSEYGPKIRELREQLQKLTDERNSKITDVLTPEQREKLSELKKAVQAKRQKAKEEKAKTAETPGDDK